MSVIKQGISYPVHSIGTLVTRNMSTPSSSELSSSRDDGIKVICAGLGRTGTVSLSQALDRLGFKSYHYVSVNHHYLWADFCRGRMAATTTISNTATVDDVIDAIVKDGYTATMDNPCCDITEDLMRRFPNAKIILTVRDTPQKFVQSWKLLFNTMHITEQRFTWSFPSFFGYIPLFSNLKSVRYFMGTTHLGLSPGQLTHLWRTMPDADDWLAKQYERHNQCIQDMVSTKSDQKQNQEKNLLVFNVKDGWEPLCQFLDISEVPSEPFPHATVNNAESLRSMKRTFTWIVYGWIPFTIIVGGVTIFLCREKRQSLLPFGSFLSSYRHEL